MFFLGPSPYRKADLYEANFRTRALRRYFSVPVPVLHKKKYLEPSFGMQYHILCLEFPLRNDGRMAIYNLGTIQVLSSTGGTFEYRFPSTDR